MFFIPFIIVFIIIVIVFFSIFMNIRNSHKEKNIYESGEIIDVDEDVEEQLISDISEISNDNLEFIHNKSFSIINQSPIGRSDTTYSYQKTGDPKLEKIYVISKTDSNYIISIYKVVYHNFFNQSDQQIVYIPAVFNDVKNDIFSSLANGKNPAPEYYFNSDKSTYIYAYGSFEEAYDSLVKPYENEYNITEK